MPIDSGFFLPSRTSPFVRPETADRHQEGAVSRRIWLWAAAFLTTILTLPFFLTEIPPVVDYPNHLARGYLLAFGKSIPVLAGMFQPHWAIIPNLACDFILPPMLHLLPIYSAGKIVLAVSLLFPLMGGVAYNFCLFRRWSFWPLGAALVAFNLSFLLGFLNFQIGMGMAFLTAAIWVGWRDRRPAAALVGVSVGGIAVFFCHLIALGLLMVLVGAYELDRLLGIAPPKRWGQTVRRVAASILVFTPSFILYLCSPTSGAEGRLIWLPASLKSLFTLAPFMNYSITFDALTGSVMVAFVGLAIWRRWLILPRATAIAILVFCVLYLISPFSIQGGAFFDIRFSVIIGYLIFVGLSEARPPKSRTAISIAVCFLMLLCLRIGLLGVAWRQQGGEVAQMREAISPIPPGSRVLVVTVFPPDPDGYWDKTPLVRRVSGIYVANAHLPALILIERHAFWQLLFSARSQQPITILPPYAQSSVAEMNWGPPSYELLEGDWKLPAIQTKFPYLKDWRSKFDFVLVLNAGGVPGRENFLSPELSLLAATDVAALYRINPTASSTSGPRTKTDKPS
jgi:hypothetical protein